MLMHDEEAFELFLQSVEILEESNELLVGDVAVTTFFVKKFSSDEMERMKGQHRTEAQCEFVRLQHEDILR